MPNTDAINKRMELAAMLGMPLSDLGRDIDQTCPELLKVLMNEFDSPKAAIICLAVFYIGMACKAVDAEKQNPIEWAHELIDTVGVLMMTGTFEYEGMGR